jgi:hypothetical protein
MSDSLQLYNTITGRTLPIYLVFSVHSLMIKLIKRQFRPLTTYLGTEYGRYCIALMWGMIDDRESHCWKQ